ncbi:copper(I)-binding protein [Skermanella stibiiresistens SB22]|uniref:Copper(I)-binding protein n=1 Tax=Skermanella stibiiresistens SB22 TaxID=1385369 RepID=W9H898_9PROT|nr:copper chaperone PCu(A)C [Skermanella stibiiresistens]EWY42475.1 copper(I)-binding protein [Skermanella stibiiresistens SB22]
MSKHSVIAGAAALVLAFVASAHAEMAKVGDLVIEQAWARATTPSAKTGATYLSVRNTGPESDSILSMETPVASHAMAHQTRQENDVSRMSEAGPLSVPPGGALEMKPGGTHIMLMDLGGGLRLGQQFPLTITFEKAGKVEIPVKVGKPGAMGPE